MTNHYVYPSRVELRETAGHRPTRDELAEQQRLTEQRRRRSAQARRAATQKGNP